MRRIPTAAWLLATALGTASGGPASPPQAPPVATAAAAKTEYPPFKAMPVALTEGERLVYQVKWGIVDAGKATLTVNGREPLSPGGPAVWNIDCRTRSSSFVSLFYKVRDDITNPADRLNKLSVAG